MRVIALTAASLISGAAIAGSAAAAPQALLLAGAGSELQLYCEGGECAAEAGTICLQPERDNPDRGTAYTIPGGGPGTGDGLSLIGHSPDGREVALPVELGLRVTAERGHTAVKLSVPQALMDRFGLSRMTVRMSRNVVLAPSPVAGDPHPQTEADLSLAQGTLRPVAEKMLDRHEARVAAARIIRDVINALPRERRTNDAEREAAWRRALGAEAAGGSDEIPDGALDHARDSFATCGSITGSPNWSSYRFRSCLGEMHDHLFGTVNTDYRKALHYGS